MNHCEAKISILKHHVRDIMAEFLLMPQEEIESHVRTVVIPRLQQMTVAGTEIKLYYSLQSAKGRQQYANAKIEAIYAVRGKRYREIPEVDPVTGRRNFDHICKTCSNKVGNDCILEERMSVYGTHRYR